MAPLVVVIGTASPSSADSSSNLGVSIGNATSAVVQQPDGSPSVFVEGLGGSLWNYWYVNGVWDSAEIVGSGVLSTPVAVLQTDGSPSVFFQGTGGSLWNYWYVNGVWDAAEILASGVASTPAVILSPDIPSVFFQGPGHSLLNVWYVPSSGSWGSATVAFPGSAYSAPAAWQSTFCCGSPAVFVIGPDQSFVEYDYQNGSWPARTVPNTGPSAASSPGLGPPNQIYAVGGAAGGSNSLAQWQAPGWGSAFNSEAQVAGPGTAYSSPAVLVQIFGYAYGASIFFVGPSDSLLNYWFSFGNQGAATVASPGSATAVIGVTAQPNGAPSAFFEGPNGTLWNAWYVSGSWDMGQVGSGLAAPNAHLSS